MSNEIEGEREVNLEPFDWESQHSTTIMLSYHIHNVTGNCLRTLLIQYFHFIKRTEPDCLEYIVQLGLHQCN